MAESSRSTVRRVNWWRRVTVVVLGLGLTASAWAHHVPRTRIFHFDVNTGDATLIVSPAGRGVLVDAGDQGRGRAPIADFLNRAIASGDLDSLDFVIATHYDAPGLPRAQLAQGVGDLSARG